ncbi:MAG TPA: peptidase E [Dactylosporangium sp.]|nr:peptidase E [Dactylosporangium sp.]
MRRIVLLGGGFSTDPDTLLDDYALGLAGRDRARVCFLPTASGDSPAYVERFHAAFGDRAEATHLPLFSREPGDPREVLLAQDVIYAGGGNTANALALWRLHGVDEALAEAYAAGVLLCGISAGAICWFEAALTDSFGGADVLRDGLGLLAGSACPHYDGEALRRPAYEAAVGSGALPGGWGIDDGVAALFTGGELTEVVSRAPGAQLRRVEPDGDGGAVTTVPLAARPLP